jgi:hypothetical protein
MRLYTITEITTLLYYVYFLLIIPIDLCTTTMETPSFLPSFAGNRIFMKVAFFVCSGFSTQSLVAISLIWKSMSVSILMFPHVYVVETYVCYVAENMRPNRKEEKEDKDHGD